MVKSFLIKLGMLAATMGAVFWIGWSVPDSTGQNGQSGSGQPMAVVSASNTGHVFHAQVGGGAAPSRPEQQAAPVVRKLAPAPPKRSEQRLDLNRATSQDLEGLPGIGPALATRIIDHRRAIGSFASVDNLLDVKGIGQKKMERLRPLVMVKPAQSAQPEKGKL